MVLKTGQMAEEGKTSEEVFELAQNLKQRLKTFLVLDTIRYVYRSGRIPEIASKIGSLLPLKPALLVFEKVHFWGAATSKEKSKEKVLKYLKENHDGNLPEIGIAYIDNLEEAEQIKKEILSFLPSAAIFITEFSPIVGYATGKGTIGISFFAKNYFFGGK